MVKLTNVLKKFNFFLLVSILFSSCILNEEEDLEYDFFVKIKNNSDHRITWYSSSALISDTVLIEKKPSLFFGDNVIEPKDSALDIGYQVNARSVFDAGLAIHFYIFKYEVVNSIPWSDVRKDYLVAKKVEFETYNELIDSNFTINYP